MDLHWLDWSIIGCLVLFIIIVTVYTQKYNRSIADYLVANRCAGRYILSISEGMSNLGAISLIALFQMSYQAGYTALWWQFINSPIAMLILVSGFVIYRFRQTRCMTLAEFFEKRYNRKFRIFAGFIIFISGLLNFGIFPSVGSRFFIYFCGFPESFQFLGITFSTYATIMFLLLLVAVYFTFAGGQITVMVTDFIQGGFVNIVFIIVIVYIFVKLDWDNIGFALSNSQPGRSLINPFEGSKIRDFNMWYFIMNGAIFVYSTRAWQGSQGYNAAALNPHEARMGGILGGIRGYALTLLSVVVPIGAYTIMHHPNFSGMSNQISSVLMTIPNEEIRDQMTVPVAMRFFLPKCLSGAFVAVFLAAFISTHNTYLHSWSSIFIQDVVMPFRKKPFATKSHMLLLRLSVIAIAVFIYFFSLVFDQYEKILIWQKLTGAVYLSGAGSVIIGGLYWKRGTTSAAFASLIVGFVLSITGIILSYINEDFFLNGMEIAFYTMLVSILTYIAVSLLSSQDANLDKILNSGQFKTQEDTVIHKGKLSKFNRRIGITKEFTLVDRCIYFYAIGFGFLNFIILVIFTFYHFVKGTDNDFWLKYWYWFTIIFGCLAFIFTVWLLIGGIIDTRKLYSRLKTQIFDSSDDGWIEREDKVESK
ncbi:MAG: sodium:solute symporter [Sedimentisphaeraceae bacterium JB056]